MNYDMFLNKERDFIVNVIRMSKVSGNLQHKLIIGGIWIGLILISGFTPCVSNITKAKLVEAQPPSPSSPSVALTRINVTLEEDETIYLRNTHIHNVVNEDDVTLRYFLTAKLTTHSDTLVEFRAEFDGDPWGGNLTEFKNSPFLNSYENYFFLEEIMAGVNASLLAVSRSTSNVFNETRESHAVFIYEQWIVLRETSAFIFTLPELFRFDKNKMELGQLTDFYFNVEYAKEDIKWVDESLRIKAPGSAIEYIPNIKGYSGRIYMTDWEDKEFGPERVPRYIRPFADAQQEIFLQIKLPIDQTQVTYGFDSTYTAAVSSEEREITNTRNIGIFFFSFDSSFPHYISIDSVTPLLEQFSFTEYISMAVGALAGLIGLLRGLPYFLNRRGFGNFKKSLHKAYKTDKEEYNQLVNLAKDKFMDNKLNAGQYHEIQSEIKLLEKMEEKSKILSSPSE